MKIFESPDVMLYKGKRLTLHDNDSYAFILDNRGNVLLGQSGLKHQEFLLNYDYSLIKGVEFKENGFYGRLWSNSKIISFWSYDVDIIEEKFLELEKILKRRLIMEKEESIFDWKVEFGGDFIKVSKFIEREQEIDFDEDKWKYHTMKSDDTRRKKE